jgi:hypothetical protein
VRQDALGRPPFVTSDSADCSVNPIFNDVVCNGPRGQAEVTTFRGADVVTLRDDSSAGGPCIPSLVDANNVPIGPPQVRATLSLGGGDDALVLPAPTCPPGSAQPGQVGWSADADGEGGDDDLTGGVGDDDLSGGFGVDTLRGGFGDDELRGCDQGDTMRGGSGDDTMRGGDGDDGFQGDSGDDVFLGALDGAGQDIFIGGPGIDTVTYVFSSQGVVVTVVAPGPGDEDGRPGENDELTSGVENVTGTQQADVLVGDANANRLEGLAGTDQITGGAGADVLLGGDGNDTLDARDGIRDQAIDCSSGAGDVVSADLADRPLFGPVGSRSSPFVPNGCEQRLFSASDDGPPGRLTSGVLRIGRGGVASVPLACPAKARAACRGVLRLRTTKPRPRIRATARYAVAPRTTEAVEITVPASLRGRTLQTETLERGVSKKGPRSAVRSVRIR